jgi:hypothetical protein
MRHRRDGEDSHHRPVMSGFALLVVPLITVRSGLSWSLTDTSQRRSGCIWRLDGSDPKLTVRVRFPSPALMVKTQVAKVFRARAARLVLVDHRGNAHQATATQRNSALCG